MADKTILLSDGKFAVIDEADHELVSMFKWRSRNHHGIDYAWGHYYDKKTQRTKKLKMHRLIMGLGGPDVDHVNGDGLDNRRCNLRHVTNQQNHFNQTKRTGFHSKFKGVSWDKSRRKWIAYIKKDYRNMHLGRFDSEIDASKAYDMAAISLFGSYARLNHG